MKRPTLKFTRRQSNKEPKPVKQLPEGVPSGKQIAGELLVVFAIIILGVTTFLWWHYIQSNPKRVFDGMLNTALQSPTGSVHITQTAEGQSLDQKIEYRADGQHVVHATTVLGQTGTTATTETIGTPSEDYVRYTGIKTDQKSADGKPLNFGPVLNQWGKSAATSSQTNGQLYNQTVLGVIPFGNLNEAQRTELLKLARKTYTVNYETLTRKVDHGRPTYTYDVTVSPMDYVAMLKVFARDTGLNQLEALNPTDYASAAPLQFKVTVDVWARQLRTITYSDSDRVEQFSQFGEQLAPLEIPKATLTVDDLQQRLEAVK